MDVVDPPTIPPYIIRVVDLHFSLNYWNYPSWECLSCVTRFKITWIASSTTPKFGISRVLFQLHACFKNSSRGTISKFAHLPLFMAGIHCMSPRPSSCAEESPPLLLCNSGSLSISNQCWRSWSVVLFRSKSTTLSTIGEAALTVEQSVGDVCDLPY